MSNQPAHCGISLSCALLGIELQPDEEVVTYVADRLTPPDDCAQFIRSLPYILARRPRAHVVVVGCDAQSYAVDRRRIHFLGQVSAEVVGEILQLARVHVCLGDPNTTPDSMLDALAAGCIVVAAKTVAARRIIQDGFNGFLVPSMAPRAIALRVVEVLQNYSALQFMCDNARGTAEEHAAVTVDLSRFYLQTDASATRLTR